MEIFVCFVNSGGIKIYYDCLNLRSISISMVISAHFLGDPAVPGGGGGAGGGGVIDPPVVDCVDCPGT